MFKTKNLYYYQLLISNEGGTFYLASSYEMVHEAHFSSQSTFPVGDNSITISHLQILITMALPMFFVFLSRVQKIFTTEALVLSRTIRLNFPIIQIPFLYLSMESSKILTKMVTRMWYLHATHLMGRDLPKYIILKI